MNDDLRLYKNVLYFVLSCWDIYTSSVTGNELFNSNF